MVAPAPEAGSAPSAIGAEKPLGRRDMKRGAVALALLLLFVGSAPAAILDTPFFAAEVASGRLPRVEQRLAFAQVPCRDAFREQQSAKPVCCQPLPRGYRDRIATKRRLGVSSVQWKAESVLALYRSLNTQRLRYRNWLQPTMKILSA